jgi:hypothetical protein
MLCYTGLGDSARAEEHKTRYLRFKADESAQAITGAYRQAHPEDNNERQAIHEHVSVALSRTGTAIKKASRQHASMKPSSAQHIAAAGGGK